MKTKKLLSRLTEIMNYEGNTEKRDGLNDGTDERGTD
jgi:hypothetical protein